jgi:proteasome assembly chaperone 2
MRFVPPPGAAAPDLKGATLVIVSLVPCAVAVADAADTEQTLTLPPHPHPNTHTPLTQPAVAFANVGELAVDAIVATLRLPLVARGADPNVLPASGHDAYDHLAAAGATGAAAAPAAPPPSAAATSLELYGDSSQKLYVLQQRAPAVPGRQRAFAEAAARAAKEGGAARVLLLCGLDAAWRREQQLDDAAAHPLRTVAFGSNGAAAADDPLAQAAQDAAGALPLEPALEADEREAGGWLPPWTLLDALAHEAVPSTLLCCFCSEGDNAPHGLALAAAALRTLARADVAVGVVAAAHEEEGGGGKPGAFDAATATAAQMRTPRSWVGLYGRRPERALY